MKYIYILVFLFNFNGFLAFGQDSFDESFNITINVDSKTYCPDIKTPIRLIYLDNDGNEVSGLCYYIPGELSMDDDIGIEYLISKGIKKITLKFTIYYIDGKYNPRDYNIEFDTSLLDPQGYLVLNVYNTDVACYKKIFDPLPGKQYTFEYRSLNYPSMYRVTKKDRKKCDCL